MRALSRALSRGDSRGKSGGEAVELVTEDDSPKQSSKRPDAKPRRPSVAKLMESGRVRALSRGHSGEVDLEPVELVAEDDTQAENPKRREAKPRRPSVAKLMEQKKVSQSHLLARKSSEIAVEFVEDADEKTSKASSSRVPKSTTDPPARATAAPTPEVVPRMAVAVDRKPAETSVEPPSSVNTKSKADSQSTTDPPARATGAPTPEGVPHAAVAVDRKPAETAVEPPSSATVTHAAVAFAVALLAILVSSVVKATLLS